jgi:hypothetical protein
MTDYKINDKVWFVPDGYLIAIECRIIEIDDYFRKKEPQAYIFYGLDEPVGHHVCETDLYEFKELALEKLKHRYKEALNESDPLLHLTVTLKEYRKSRIKFIVSTWEGCSEKEKTCSEIAWQLELFNKMQGKEWFNIENI